VNKKKKKLGNVIAENRRARFNFELTNKFEAGVSLEGWEVRSIRLGKAQIAESYVLLKESEGQTCVPTKLFWKNNLVKCEIALATGKQGKDKRQTIKARDWDRQKARELRSRNKN